MSKVSSETTGVSALSRRYARALFELADEQKQLDEVASDLASITAMMKEPNATVPMW